MRYRTRSILRIVTCSIKRKMQFTWNRGAVDLTVFALCSTRRTISVLRHVKCTLSSVPNLNWIPAFVFQKFSSPHFLDMAFSMEYKYSYIVRFLDARCRVTLRAATSGLTVSVKRFDGVSGFFTQCRVSLQGVGFPYTLSRFFTELKKIRNRAIFGSPIPRKHAHA